ncbi:hypothetical protein PRIPAC_71899 [Pristionchus pacificus]|uniref:DUF7622 domain-containing protein n=1 Tax=Pristionchus pacificus TaxID=54126 RepID=A0A2A6BRH8_PRIPA|nr:hypothetical protein PRIPAC_71899 [Pristionchus pacificus]|eukprot:PDM68505.1 hypothetical protein PRIPAC_44007 [Pristionchus pacificus]
MLILLLVSGVMFQATQARTCYPLTNTSKPYHVLDKTSVQTPRRCEVFCDANTRSESLMGTSGTSSVVFGKATGNQMNTSSYSSDLTGITHFLPCQVDRDGEREVSAAHFSGSPDEILEASVLDASVLDASVLDASVLEASVLDASVLDASVLDASVLDASVLDAGRVLVKAAKGLIDSVIDASFHSEFLREVTCLLGRTGNQTCTGDLCYIIYSKILASYRYTPERGCITNNETLNAKLYQSGYFTLTYDYQLVICDKNKCNKNLKKAKKSVTIIEPSCPAPASTATTERNWAAWAVTKPTSIWSRLASDFIATLTGFIDD